jgi:hypothetical protein
VGTRAGRRRQRIRHSGGGEIGSVMCWCLTLAFILFPARAATQHSYAKVMWAGRRPTSVKDNHGRDGGTGRQWQETTWWPGATQWPGTTPSSWRTQTPGAVEDDATPVARTWHHGAPAAMPALAAATTPAVSPAAVLATRTECCGAWYRCQPQNGTSNAITRGSRDSGEGVGGGLRWLVRVCGSDTLNLL